LSLFVLLIGAFLWFRGGSGPSSYGEASDKIKVEVLNGCGVNGLARRVSDFLRTEGFDVVNGNGGNAESFGFVESIVVDRVGDISKAEKVAKVLGVGNCLRQVDMDPYRIEEVTVIIGRDYRKLRPFAGKAP